MPIDPAKAGRGPENLILPLLFCVIASLAFSISLYETTSWILIGLCTISAVRRKRYAIFKNVFFAAALVYILVNLISVSQSAYPEVSLKGVFKVLKNVLLCSAAFYAVDSPEKLRKVFFCFLIVTSVICLDALIQGVVGVDLIRSRQMTNYSSASLRLTGPFHHANDFGAYLSFMMMLFAGAVFLMRRELGKKYFFCLIGFFMSAVCLMGTYSRGAWVAVPLGCIFLALVSRNKALLLLVAAFCIWTLFLSPPLMRSRALSLFNEKNSTISERKVLWQSAFRMVREKPLLGFGANTYAKNAPRYKEDPAVDDQYAHNGYLQMAAETGLIGLGSFLAVIICFYISTLSAFMKENNIFLKAGGLTLLSAVFSFLVHSATDTDLQSTLLVNTLWLGMGIALSAGNLSRSCR